ncbi:peroxisomal NADH pyrophosphatase NUDT12-like isoform X2 [Mizuhopecten yessoensis]|uniref:peroxisomal NADH pyrophosphatase NUDT12-like isoform X2 n=1 Tax=Mizuhopecten yessoensis TaxID=6573 RepID=UPI000B458570|nr:peroxisomal NADH pyrophosphatase NUDT12-like isoform X2 [Mizuhopecten yessoensis]
MHMFTCLRVWQFIVRKPSTVNRFVVRMSSTDRTGPSDTKKSFEDKYFDCAANGNVEELKFLLQATFNSDHRNDKGWTALMLAARNGQVHVIEALLQKGCDINLVNKTGQTAEDIAVFWDQKKAANMLTDFIKKENPDKQLRNYFSLNNLDRMAENRKDKDWLQSRLKKETTRFIIFSDLKPLVRLSGDATQRYKYTLVRLAYSDIEFLLKTNPLLVFLGVESDESTKDNSTVLDEAGQALFALDVTDTDESKFKTLVGEAEFTTSYHVLMQLEPSDAGIFAEARSLLDWLDRYKFCATCGSATTVAEGGYKRICDNKSCRTNKGIHNTCYPRTDPSVIMLVVSPDGKRCLLGRKKQFPAKMYSCLAGFMEPGEALEDTCRREVYEESGVRVGRVDYHSSQPWPFPCSLMLGCLAHATSENIKVGEDEMEDVQWFRRSELVQMLTKQHPQGLYIPPEQAIAHQIIKAWVRMTANL